MGRDAEAYLLQLSNGNPKVINPNILILILWHAALVHYNFR